jgi:glutathione S-transferase
MDIEIIGAPQSSFVRTVRIACEEKGAPYRLTPAMPHSDDVMAIHPLGKIPVMRHGRVEIFESRAIAGYVDRIFPGPRLFPDDAERGAQIEQWVSACNSNILPSLNGYLQCFFFSGAPNGGPDEAGMAARLPEVEALIGLLDRAVGTSGHLGGQDFSYADMNLLPVVDYLSEVPQSAKILAEAKNLAAYLATHSQRPSFRATKPPTFANLAN